MNALKKYLPNNFSVGTGFIMNKGDYESISTQIDVIVYENNCPVIFREGDFVIVNSTNVVGIIEVKSKFINSDFERVFKKAEDVGELVDRKIFNGIFYYSIEGNVEFENTYINPSFKAVLENSKGKVNHIAIGENKFVRYWENGNQSANSNSPSMSLYNLNSLSFSYFISNLIEMAYCLSSEKDLNDIYWFLYPFENSKESTRKNNILLRER